MVKKGILEQAYFFRIGVCLTSAYFCPRIFLAGVFLGRRIFNIGLAYFFVEAYFVGVFCRRIL